ncbi:MAG: HAMP domain-containing histidine kinase [Clostridia bacterium]|nr:HAMP domain-containing histidine kinase [Clostridia bacterium]
MAKKKAGKVREHFSHIPRLVFIQFFLILLVVVTLILFTSVSFYQSIVESVTAFKLRDVITEVQKENPDSISVDNKIHQVERDKSIIVEIYSKADEYDTNYSQPVYSQSVTYWHANDPETSHINNILNFNYQKFMKSDGRTYKNTKAGRFTNPVTNFEYYVVVTPSADNELIYIAAIRSNQISIQADAISLSVSLILIITFITVSIVAFLFITRITKPLRYIRDVTKAMAETNDSRLRIPTMDRTIKTETDDTVDSVNYLYESLIITQENLLEKTEFLYNQLEERDAEQKAREEFIASTSHELKTPIAIIQGYAEGAKYLANDPEGLDEYCDTIIDECVRMNNLVVNMMSLSNIQQTKTLNFREFSIRDFVSERFRLLDKTFEKKDIKTENLITDDIWGKGDTEKLNYVINNLLSNAISYVGGDPKIIRARYEDMGIVYRVFIFNSGENIPQAEIEKLWESFYRNDPARNRNEGHFGLGLSIVKSVQDAHSQACGVDNTDGGVEFWFDILK